ncbi:MAG TPA: hypothetical protein VFQ30_19330 [Ktedonobacteraceae bacterium]|nr:hypothetical protein [Ktedonobacteraceae bacterium]
MKTLKSSKTLRFAARHATLQAQGLKSFAYKTGMKTTSIYITENMLEEIMTERLQQAIERLQQLPDAAQNAIAERILDEIDEQEWDEIVKKPHVQHALRRLAKEARRQNAAGETEEGGFAIE